MIRTSLLLMGALLAAATPACSPSAVSEGDAQESAIDEAGSTGFVAALRALQAGDGVAFDAALERVGDIDQTDALGLTLAMHAAALGRSEALQRLAERDADVLRSNARTGASILHFAAQAPSGSVDVVRWVRARIGDAPFLSMLNSRIRSNNHTVAMEAVFNINEPLVRELLSLRRTLGDIDFATTAVTGWGPQTFAFRERYAFASELPPSAVTVPELARFLEDGASGPVTRDEVLARLAEARGRWSEQQDAAYLASTPDRATQVRGQELLSAIAAARGGTLELGDFEARVRESRTLVNGTFGRMGATLLSAVPAPGLSAEQLGRAERIQDILLRAGADPNVAESGLMLVPAGFRESVFGYSTMIERYLDALSGEARTRFLDARGALNGYSKLIDAALRGRRDVICVLVAAGADRSAVALNGLTARAAAERFNASTSDPASRLAPSVVSALDPTSAGRCP